MAGERHPDQRAHPGDRHQPVSLVVGNQIIDPASFQAVVTAATSGPQSETITYSAWSVDPAMSNRLRHEGFGAVPTPDAVVASAHAFADLYGEIPNTNLCNWIGDNVAAGAGAPMPLPDALLDPTSNVAGGFWRVHYRGSNSSLITNWSGLVLPGDIVRMGWFKPETGAELGHTTTVLGAVGADGRSRCTTTTASSPVRPAARKSSTSTTPPTGWPPIRPTSRSTASIPTSST